MSDKPDPRKVVDFSQPHSIADDKHFRKEDAEALESGLLSRMTTMVAAKEATGEVRAAEKASDSKKTLDESLRDADARAARPDFSDPKLPNIMEAAKHYDRKRDKAALQLGLARAMENLRQRSSRASSESSVSPAGTPTSGSPKSPKGGPEIG